MEDTKMEMVQEAVKLETHLTSAAAFVEGGIQDSCDDACSICLESFCESDPSTVTTCKHEFHLQCILEWCQRSSQCPMCWQPISLKDPTGQELLEAVEHERSFRFNPSRNTTIFHHPTLGDFELQHLPVGVDDSELEERIIQHLAAAAAMGRTRHVTRRQGQSTRLSSHGRPHYLVFSAHPNEPHSGAAASTFPADVAPITSSSPPLSEEDSALLTPPSSGEDHATAVPVSQQGSPLNNRRLPAQSLQSTGQDQGGPSFSESMKSRFTAVSSKCKESITKSTRGWKERLFSRNTSMADISSEVKREVNAGIATVSRMIERLETRDGKAASSSVSNSTENVPEPESGNGNQHVTVTNADNNPSSTIPQVSRATDSCPAET